MKRAIAMHFVFWDYDGRFGDYLELFFFWFVSGKFQSLDIQSPGEASYLKR